MAVLAFGMMGMIMMIHPASAFSRAPAPSFVVSSPRRAHRFLFTQATTTLSITTSATRLYETIQQPFGQQEYWQDWYHNRTQPINNNSNNNNNSTAADEDTGDFSWYASWQDLAPLVEEFDLLHKTRDPILLPGIGLDATLALDMITDGYQHLYAMDYAPASIAYLQERWTAHQQDTTAPTRATLELCVADVRELPYATASMQAILDKGTLDAVYLNGATPAIRLDNLRRGVMDLQRCLRPGGLFWSLSGVCVDAWDRDAWFPDKEWECLCDTRDGVLFMTPDSGYTSNNVNGELLVWRKKKNEMKDKHHEPQ